MRQLNARVEKPVWHTSLNFPESDKVSPQLMVEIAKEFATDFGLQNNQYVVILHNDTPTHAHFHIIANRVGFDKKTVSDSHNYKRIAQFCRRMEKKYHLEKVLSPPGFANDISVSDNRIDKRKEAIKTSISNALNVSISMPQFTEKLSEKGIETEIGKGIAFIDNKKVRVKGSQIGFSLRFIK